MRTALVTLAALAIAGCQVVSGHDAKGNGFFAAGLLTTPEVAKAKVGDMSVQGYSRGVDADAMGAIVSAAVKAAK